MNYVILYSHLFFNGRKIIFPLYFWNSSPKDVTELYEFSGKLESSQEGNLLRVTTYKGTPPGLGTPWDPNHWRQGEHLKEVSLYT